VSRGSGRVSPGTPDVGHRLCGDVFGEKTGTLLSFVGDAHDIEDQDDSDADSQITDGDRVARGRLP